MNEEYDGLIISVTNIDEKQLDVIMNIWHKIASEYRYENLRHYGEITQEKCVSIMRRAYKHIFDECEKFSKNYIKGDRIKMNEESEIIDDEEVRIEEESQIIDKEEARIEEKSQSNF